ncbi:MAG: hypothetical protein KC731_31145 [Myxococcales bacterium]|nr:hypothetical protein [Myxococcales bacterium]
MGQPEDDLTPEVAATIAASRCRVLWISVVHLALQDAARGDRRARAWLGTEGCATICRVAGIDIRWVRSFDLSRLQERTRGISTSLVIRRRAQPRRRPPRPRAALSEPAAR